MKVLAPDKWNHQYAAHLLARSGFGATPEQIDIAARRPFTEVINGLFKSRNEPDPPDWVVPGIENKPDFKALRQLPEAQRRQQRNAMRKEQNRQHRDLLNWWLRQMINTPCPLQEKMALFWHGHFATSIRKVRTTYMMYLQNQTLRKLAMGSYEDLITAIAQDPAMLIYLDNTRSRAGAPNENFARELMELFTLGEGHYTEQDIKEAARAFTGWMVAPRKYEFLDATASGRRGLHDNGAKEFFEKRGNFDGNDIIRIILNQEQAARFLVTKLWRFFAYDNPESDIIEALSEEFRRNGYDLTPLLKSIFSSEAFYSDKALRTQIKSPVQWLAGSCIMLGREPPNPGLCFNALRSLGQELFAPPNVKGWDGGYAWITTSTLTQRYNLADSLVNSRKKSAGARTAVNGETILPRNYRTRTEAAQNYLERRVYQSRLAGEERNNLSAYLSSLPPSNQWTDAQIRTIYRTMMCTPQFQLT